MTQRLLHSHANSAASKLEDTLTPNGTDHEERDGLILKSPTDSSNDLESKMVQDPDNLYYKLERGMLKVLKRVKKVILSNSATIQNSSRNLVQNTYLERKIVKLQEYQNSKSE